MLTHFILPATPLENLQYLWQRIKHWYSVVGTRHRYHYFNRLTMFVRKSGPPKLRGRGARSQWPLQYHGAALAGAYELQLGNPQGDPANVEVQSENGIFDV